ncbi:exostosin domain-containing protein [Hymenobacter arizonensis]|uniref:Exostosin family protein n=1 Tax=Hymenobacter arizonensis TaxID=1227077 RepID=A0A1I6BRT7_HYMAR|nr:exostosin family protein [Hymenobacter arizonensis]SFQ83649.1 Exostosin family protein [Hymenobacter arizonensis]
MKVFITSAYPSNPLNNFTPAYLEESAKADPFKCHQLVQDPQAADIIIFAEHHPAHDPYFFAVLQNEIYRQYRHKCYLYHDNYATIPLIPTVTPVLSLQDYFPDFTQPFSYIVQLIPNTEIRDCSGVTEKKYLFSFVGAGRTHPIRKSILTLCRDDVYLGDTSDKDAWALAEDDYVEYQASYAEICRASKFILCPRGLAANSYRLYECLQMGIPPVIISDEWVPTVGPKWEEFSIRVSEAEIANIPAILKEKEPSAAHMGLLARQAWEEWFTKDKQFHYLTEACLRLHSTRKERYYLPQLKLYKRFLQPSHARNLLRYYKNALWAMMK